MKIRTILLLVGLAGIAWSSLACPPGESTTTEEAAVEEERLPCVTVEPVAARVVRDDLVIRANLIAERMSIVLSQSNGHIAHIQVSEGDVIVGGETVMLTIEAEELDIGVDAAQSGVDAARAGVNQAELALSMAEIDLARAQALLERGAATQEQVDRAATMVESLREGVRQGEAQVRMARNVVRQAREIAGDTDVMAPFDGVVLRKFVEVGEVVGSFPPSPLFQVIDPQEIRVVAHVPERDAARISAGLPMQIELGDGRELSAQVDYLAPGLDPLSRTLEVRALLDNSAGELRHGQSAWVRIDLGEQERAFLPRHVFKRVEGNRGYLFALNDDGRSVRELVVRLGSLQDDGYPVIDGIEAGASIVTHGWTPLSEGTLVQVAVDGVCAQDEN